MNSIIETVVIQSMGETFIDTVDSKNSNLGEMEELIKLYSADDMPPTRRLYKAPVTVEYDDGPAHKEEVGKCFEVLPPNGSRRVLLHSCCAPCSGAMVEEMLSKGLEITIFFYNPNIHPRKEYEIRKNENKRYALKHNIPFVDCDYDAESWFERMNGLELDPERGIRCTACFDMRMEVTAAYAAANGFVCFTTTNATSRWKDINQVNTAGLLAASHYEGLDYWVYDWQTDSMTMRKYEISVGEKFYKQEYCGCAYSLRDSNIWRKQQGIPPVRIGGEEAGLGERYFTDVAVDAAEESQEVVDQFFADAEKAFGNPQRAQRVDEKRVTKVSQVMTGRAKSADDALLNNW